MNAHEHKVKNPNGETVITGYSCSVCHRKYIVYEEYEAEEIKKMAEKCCMWVCVKESKS